MDDKKNHGVNQTMRYSRIVSDTYEIIEENIYCSKIPGFSKDELSVVGIVFLLANRQGSLKKKNLIRTCSKNGISKDAVISSVRKMIYFGEVWESKKDNLELTLPKKYFVTAPSHGIELSTITNSRRISKQKIAIRELTLEMKDYR